MIKKVIAQLEELFELYEKLYALSQEKQRAIIQNDEQKVRDISKEEWAIVAQVTELEEKRAELIEMHFGKGGTKPLTLDDVIAKAKPEEKELLQTEAKKLREQLEKQQKINDENQSLINLHLEYVDYMVNTVLKEPQVSSIYGNSGTVEEPLSATRVLIDSEV